MAKRTLKRDALARLVALSSARTTVAPETPEPALIVGRWLEGGCWSNVSTEPAQKPVAQPQR